MNTNAILERFILDELLLGNGPQSIEPDESLIATQLLDSLSLLRLILFIEERFKVIIEDGELIPDNFQTLNHIKTLIERKQPTS